MENKVILLNGGQDYDVEPLASADTYLTRLLGSESARRAMFFLRPMEKEGNDLRVGVFVGGQHVGYLAADVDKGLVATVKACEVHGVVARARGSLLVSEEQLGKVKITVDLAEPDDLLVSPEATSQSTDEPQVPAPEPSPRPTESPQVQPAEAPHLEVVEESQLQTVEELEVEPLEELLVPAAIPFPPSADDQTTPADGTPEVPASIAVPGTAMKAASTLPSSYEDAAALVDLGDAETTIPQPVKADPSSLDSGLHDQVTPEDSTADFPAWPPPKPKSVLPVTPVAPPAAPQPASPRPVEPQTPTPVEPTAPVQPTASPMWTAPIEPATPIYQVTPDQVPTTAEQPTAVPLAPPAPPSPPVQTAEPSPPVSPAAPAQPTPSGDTQASEQSNDWFKAFSTKRASWSQSETPQPGWLGFKASQKQKAESDEEGKDKPNNAAGSDNH